MRTISLSQKRNPKLDFSYVELNQSHYDELLNEDTTVIGPDGEIIFILLKRILSPAAVGQAWKAIEDWNPKSNSRAQAKGIKQEFKFKDGKKTMRKIGHTYCSSGVMGYFDRFPTIPACRACAINQQQPEKLKLMEPLTKEVWDIHGRYDVKSLGVYNDFAAKVHADWKIAGTPYNTMTVNKNFQTFPHKDGKNLPVTCPMTIIRKGQYRGGYLVFPEWRVACQLDTTDLILFMNSTEWHGNTRITGVSPDYVRASIIWYGRKKMGECLSAKEEIARLQNMHTGPNEWKDEE